MRRKRGGREKERSSWHVKIVVISIWFRQFRRNNCFPFNPGSF